MQNSPTPMQEVLRSTKPNDVDPLIEYLLNFAPTEGELFATAAALMNADCFQTVVTALMMMKMEGTQPPYDYVNSGQIRQFMAAARTLQQDSTVLDFTQEMLQQIISPSETMLLKQLLVEFYQTARFGEGNAQALLGRATGQFCRTCNKTVHPPHSCQFVSRLKETERRCRAELGDFQVFAQGGSDFLQEQPVK